MPFNPNAKCLLGEWDYKKLSKIKVELFWIFKKRSEWMNEYQNSIQKVSMLDRGKKHGQFQFNLCVSAVSVSVSST
jgi:GTP cyclohydrolase FolE2